MKIRKLVILFMCCLALIYTIKFAVRLHGTTSVKTEKSQEMLAAVDSIVESISYVPMNLDEMLSEEIFEYRRTDIPMSIEHQELLFKACQETGCAYATALAVCWVETGMRNIVGDSGSSLGYMQIQPRWVQQRMKDLGVTDLMDAYSNFLVGTSILAEYINEHGTINGLTKYNSGHIGYSRYAEKVLEYRKGLESEFN